MPASVRRMNDLDVARFGFNPRPETPLEKDALVDNCLPCITVAIMTRLFSIVIGVNQSEVCL